MLNKILLTIILFTITISASEEFTSERFLGIEAGYGTVKYTNKIGVTQSEKGVEFGFRIGAQNDEWRTTISAHNFNKNGEKYFRTMLQFDKFLWTNLYKTDNIIFKPYIGAHIGWLKYMGDNSSSDDQGMIYGGQVGLAWNVLREVDFDFGYRYSISDINKVDDIGSVVFAVNYLY
ncbi:MAG: porin family protein [Epsilonproteobacteria bacterium]|nr:porin family protein [Campylobacterota bacterium]